MAIKHALPRLPVERLVKRLLKVSFPSRDDILIGELPDVILNLKVLSFGQCPAIRSDSLPRGLRFRLNFDELCHAAALLPF